MTLFALPFLISPCEFLQALGRFALLTLGQGTLERVAAADLPVHAQNARALRLVRVSQHSAW